MDEPQASPSSSRPISNTVTIIVLGMAGSGKSSFVQRLSAHLRQEKVIPYLVNLDPAVKDVPYAVNVDIRDTVKYKEIMKDYGLGPNGAIMTCLNLLCTRFNQVVDFIKSHADQCPYCIIDTPGQIEAFTWSASGSIITDSLASSFPTMIAFIVDSVRAANPTTFMSNMLYACSILYRTKLPFLLVFNKADIVKPTFATNWMNDFESFQEALDQHSSCYMNDLTRSMSLVLDQFYQNLPTVAVSSYTGEGFEDFIQLSKNYVKDYFDLYRPMYDKLVKEKEEGLAGEAVEKLESLVISEKVIVEHIPSIDTPPVQSKIHIG